LQHEVCHHHAFELFFKGRRHSHGLPTLRKTLRPGIGVQAGFVSSPQRSSFHRELSIICRGTVVVSI
jgi:hypothetical protein